MFLKFSEAQKFNKTGIPAKKAFLVMIKINNTTNIEYEKNKEHFNRKFIL